MRTVGELEEAYRDTSLLPTDVLTAALDRIENDSSNAWITVRDREAMLARARELDSEPVAEYPLYGVPFAVKDNIDVAGLPTTAGCPAYAYEPDESAHVVRRLTDAGAVLVGKTNMDQFATGLVGTRSPYGACHNPRNEAYISGGSSSGSAVAVTTGQVAFALGTDTAGSGRVPAAFNDLVGLKPTRGAVSTRGVVPACRTLDCVAIFAETVEGTRRVGDVAYGYDEQEAYSRPRADSLSLSPPAPETVTVGIPDEPNLEFFGDSEAAALFEDVLDRLDSLPYSVRTIDFTPFVETAQLLYQGPWVAERYAAVGEFIENNPDAVNPVVADIIRRGGEYSATETFEAFYELEAYRRQVSAVFEDVDVLLTPTTGTIYTTDEIRDRPVERNSNLGYYNNFANLLDLCAITVPGGTTQAGPTFGVTVFGVAFDDALVAEIGRRVSGT
jgi:allophanate hydrolase